VFLTLILNGVMRTSSNYEGLLRS